MRILSLRLIVALIVGVTLVSVASSWYEVQAEKDALRHDLEHKADAFGESLAGIAEMYMVTADRVGLEQMVQHFSNRDHLFGIGIYDRDGTPLVITPNLGSGLPGTPQMLTEALQGNRSESRFMRLHFKQVYVLAAPLHVTDTNVLGGIVIVYDTGYIRSAVFRLWGQVFIRIALQMLVIVAITLLIVRWSLAGPIARAAQWMKTLRTGRHAVQPPAKDLDFLLPLAREMAPLAESMQQARAAAVCHTWQRPRGAPAGEREAGPARRGTCHVSSRRDFWIAGYLSELPFHAAGDSACWDRGGGNASGRSAPGARALRKTSEEDSNKRVKKQRAASLPVPFSGA